MEKDNYKVVVDDKIPFIKGVFESIARVEYLPGKSITNKDLSDAIALITRTRTKCNESLLSNTPIKCIASATIGFDHIDTAYCEKNNINWSNAPGCNSGSVEQYIAAVLINICLKEDTLPSNLTLGIVGVGNVGSKVAKVAGVLGFRVMLNDPPRARKEGDDKFETLSRIAKKADIITFHTPLTLEGNDKTFHLFNERFLDKLNHKPYIINSSRGEVTCNKTLLEGLNKKKLRGIILDVWENEPFPNSELVEKAFIATPHIAGYSVDGKANGTMQSVAYVKKCIGINSTPWKPSNLPLPENPLVKLNCKKLSLFQAASKAILHTYDIAKESAIFKENINNFEDLRGNYPVRREFHAYTVEFKHESKECSKLISKLGFNLA